MFKRNVDGSYLFAKMGSGGDETTCFVDARTGDIAFEGSNAHKAELFEKAKALIEDDGDGKGR